MSEKEPTSHLYDTLTLIEQCFTFLIWCEDFSQHLCDEDLIWGLAHSRDLVSRSTLAYSLIALRRLDDFLSESRNKTDDVIIADLGIKVADILGEKGRLLEDEIRTLVNKKVAHFTSMGFIEDDTETIVFSKLQDSMPIFKALVDQLETVDTLDQFTENIEQSRKWLRFSRVRTHSQ